jgi:CRISPR-associated protein Csm4
MNYTACLLRFHSGLHLGEREAWWGGTGFAAHSDTLFGAYCHGYRLLYGEAALTELLQRFRQGAPPFLLSSAFPFWDGTFYLPIPRCQIPAAKEQKKITFVGLEAWNRLIKGEDLADVGPQAALLPRPKKQGAPAVPWTIRDVPRVGLNRLNAHPDEAFFYFGEAWYREDAGLYFLFQVWDPQDESRFRAVWRLLAHEGLGGDRTVGKGQFHPPDFQSLSLTAPADATHSVALSLYYPRPEEISGLSEAYYDLLDRRGYIFSPAGQSIRRRPTRFFAEGSVFPVPPPRTGLLVDVTPSTPFPHPVYRSGLLMAVPCCLPRGKS